MKILNVIIRKPNVLTLLSVSYFIVFTFVKTKEKDGMHVLTKRLSTFRKFMSAFSSS